MALPATNIFEVRTTGSDTANGGGFDPSVTSPGTDFSQQDAAQVSYSDLVIGATTTNLTSAAHPFGATHVGNTIQITGGTGFTTGFYSVRSVSGTTATMDRAVGTAASTGGVGGLGGALASPGAAAAAATFGNTVWVKTGTYLITSASTNVSGGCVSSPASSFNSNLYIVWAGYNATRGDLGTKPVFRASGISNATLFTASNSGVILDNIEFDGNSLSGIRGYTVAAGNAFRETVRRCTFRNFTNSATNSGALSGCLITGCTTQPAVLTPSFLVEDCVVQNNSAGGISVGSDGVVIAGCLVTGNSVGVLAQGGGWMSDIRNCTIANNTSHGVSNWPFYAIMTNCLVYGNGGSGVSSIGTANGGPSFFNCAFGSNTSGKYPAGTTRTYNEVTLTADPFVNAAGGNFALNSVAGGGALCRAAGLGTFPGLSTTVGYPDIGAVQSQAAGGGLLFGAGFDGGYE